VGMLGKKRRLKRLTIRGTNKIGTIAKTLTTHTPTCSTTLDDLP
jgi:hypothetical protein